MVLPIILILLLSITCLDGFLWRTAIPSLTPANRHDGLHILSASAQRIIWSRNNVFKIPSTNSSNDITKLSARRGGANDVMDVNVDDVLLQMGLTQVKKKKKQSNNNSNVVNRRACEDGAAAATETTARKKGNSSPNKKTKLYAKISINKIHIYAIINNCILTIITIAKGPGYITPDTTILCKRRPCIHPRPHPTPHH
mmetsp:Transcript_18319/g.44123  ORF Transcript_18319/g.44123 Transcript_18319/m.44123 type:complete len:198 (-) Transcript_18319:1464-2057(-)